MKRALLAIVVAALAAELVASVYSSSLYAFWSRHDVAQMVIAFAPFPTVYLVSPILGLLGVDAARSTTPLIVAAFIQWLLAAYLIGGIFFRDKDARSSPGGLRG